MQRQQRPQPTSWKVLVLGWPFRDVSNCGKGVSPCTPLPEYKLNTSWPPGEGSLTLGKATQHPSAKGNLEWAAVPSKPPKRGSEEYTTASTTPSSPNAAHPSISRSSLPHSCQTWATPWVQYILPCFKKSAHALFSVSTE